MAAIAAARGVAGVAPGRGRIIGGKNLLGRWDDHVLHAKECGGPDRFTATRAVLCRADWG
jgi:hypothetical protein